MGPRQQVSLHNVVFVSEEAGGARRPIRSICVMSTLCALWSYCFFFVAVCWVSRQRERMGCLLTDEYILGGEGLAVD